MAGKNRAGKTLSVIGNVILWLFLALCLVAVVFSVVSKKNEDGAVTLFGHEMRIVISPSMSKSDMTDVSGFKIKSIPVDSLVIIERVPEEDEKAEQWYAELSEGDVLTFQYSPTGERQVVTHRIIGIEKPGKGYKITLRGDNRVENEDVQVIYTDTAEIPDQSTNSPTDHVIGKVVAKSLVLGKIVTILQKPVGIALVIIVPAAIVMIFQIIRIVNVINGEKRKKSEAKQAAQEDEIEALKRRLAEMEQRAETPKSEEGNDNPSTGELNGTPSIEEEINEKSSIEIEEEPHE